MGLNEVQHNEDIGISIFPWKEDEYIVNFIMKKASTICGTYEVSTLILYTVINVKSSSRAVKHRRLTTKILINFLSLKQSLFTDGGMSDK